MATVPRSAKYHDAETIEGTMSMGYAESVPCAFALQEEEQGSARAGLATTSKAIRLASTRAPVASAAPPDKDRGLLHPSYYLARIIHQPEKSTKADNFVLQMKNDTTISQADHDPQTIW